VGIRDAHQLEQALHAAVLTPATVQGVKADLGFHLGQALGKVAPGVNARDPIAEALERLSAGCTRIEAHLALGGEATKENGDVAQLTRCQEGIIPAQEPPAMLHPLGDQAVATPSG
jgi:hypothetical protein